MTAYTPIATRVHQIDGNSFDEELAARLSEIETELARRSRHIAPYDQGADILRQFEFLLEVIDRMAEALSQAEADRQVAQELGKDMRKFHQDFVHDIKGELDWAAIKGHADKDHPLVQAIRSSIATYDTLRPKDLDDD